LEKFVFNKRRYNILIEIIVTVDEFNGKITDTLTISAKKGATLIVTEEAWNVIQKKHKKWFQFVKEVKKEVKKEPPKEKEVSKKEEEKEMSESPSNKMFERYKNK